MLRNLFFGKRSEQGEDKSEQSDSDNDIDIEQNEKIQVIEHVKIIPEDMVLRKLNPSELGIVLAIALDGVAVPTVILATMKQPTSQFTALLVQYSGDEAEESDPGYETRRPAQDSGDEAQESYHGDELEESDPDFVFPTQWPSHNSGGGAEGSIEDPSSGTKRQAEDSGDEAEPPTKVSKTATTRLARTKGRAFLLPSASTSAESSSERQSGAGGTQPSVSHASANHGSHDSPASAGRDQSPATIGGRSYIGQDDLSETWDSPPRRGSFPSNAAAAELLRPFSQRRRLDGQSWPENWLKAIPSPSQQVSLWETSTPLDISGPPQPSEGPARHPSDGAEGDEASQIAAAYRRQGAQFQTWIEDPNAPGCTAMRSTMTWDDLIEEPSGEERMQPDRISTGSNFLRSPPFEVEENMAPELSLENAYRKVHFQRFAHGQVGWSWNLFIHRTGPGVLFVENIRRIGGPYWSEVAQAVYSMDHDINTLRYVYFLNVINHETRGYAQYTLYPRLGRPHLAADHATHILEYGTQEYQELLGTQLGRGVARLVLGAWDRGTHRIERIYIWAFLGNVQLRFDLRAL